MEVFEINYLFLSYLLTAGCNVQHYVSHFIFLSIYLNFSAAVIAVNMKPFVVSPLAYSPNVHHDRYMLMQMICGFDCEVLCLGLWTDLLVKNI